MTATKFLKGECGECHGHIEFPAEAAGTTTDCPHCGNPTELLLAAPEPTRTIPVKTIVFIILAVLILVCGIAGAMIALKRAQRLAERQRQTATAPVVQKAASAKPADPFADAGFHVSPVTVEKTQGSSLVYAVGTIRNTTNRQRFGVRVELDLFDAAGVKVGDAKDYQRVIEPNDEWHFRATVLEKKAVSAKIVSVKEDQ